MRGLVILSLLLASASVASAQNAAPRAALPAAGSPGELESLRQRLLTSQLTIASLELELEKAKANAAALEQCRVKNGKLVSIGRQLVMAYEERYRRDRHHDPLQATRLKFEYELQTLTEAIYDNHADAPIRVPDPKPAKASEAAQAGETASAVPVSTVQEPAK